MRLLDHLRLCRLPLAATCVTDVWVGAFGAPRLAGDAALPPLPLGTLLLIHGASLALYAAGMTLNDVFDAPRDRTLYPGRPIPSGRVPWGHAAMQGALLLALGLVLAALAGGRYGAIAVGLGAAIVLYDGLLKRFPLPGALAMGACRYLDVQLGAGFQAGPLFLPAVVLGLYVTALTYASTLEERPEAASRLGFIAAAVGGGLMGAGYGFPHFNALAWFYALTAGTVLALGRRAAVERSRRSVKALVLAMLLGIFAVNAGSLAGLGETRLGLTALGLALTFPLLGRLLGAPAPASASVAAAKGAGTMRPPRG